MQKGRKNTQKEEKQQQTGQQTVKENDKPMATKVG